ncbi:hypothetical protein Hanom_Chr01g00006661 [Helianthus anomalus]
MSLFSFSILETNLKLVAEHDQKFRRGGKSWDSIYILYKYLGKIIGGTILYNFKIFRRKMRNFTFLTETFGDGCTPHFTLCSALA